MSNQNKINILRELKNYPVSTMIDKLDQVKEALDWGGLWSVILLNLKDVQCFWKMIYRGGAKNGLYLSSNSFS